MLLSELQNRLKNIAQSMMQASQPAPVETPKPMTWDEAENRIYEYGVSNAVLFLMNENGTYSGGLAWNGITNITDAPDGAEINKLFADGVFYAGIRGSEEYHASIEAFTYPDEFSQCDGSVQLTPGMYASQQSRRKFGMCWRTEIGNANTHHLGYKIHVAYGLTASPAERSHETVNDSPEANPFSWDIDGSSVPINGHKPTMKLEFDSTKLSKARMRLLEDLLYGGLGSSLPLPNDLLNLLEYAYDSDTIGRQQITGEIDYIKDGILYRGANAPTILINAESDLGDLALICNPGSFAFNQDMSRMWQLSADETWVRMI